MERIYVTVLEPTLECVLERVDGLPPGGYGIELRADHLERTPSPSELSSFRSRIDRPLLYTRRSAGAPPPDPGAADERMMAAVAGFDLVDVEVDPSVPVIPRALESFREKLLVSVHDFRGTPDLDRLASRLAELGHFKIAATPATLADNIRLLETQQRHASRSSVFGMGTAGLYSRTLSPFFGGAPAFASVSNESPGAPGQLPVERMLAILGDRAAHRPVCIFAIVGKPVAHSRSPEIHNAIFRSKQVPAAYSFLEVEEIDEVLDAMSSGSAWSPDGISITTPFKVTALEYLERTGGPLSERARVARAVNTIVRRNGRLHGDNTDVAGFDSLLRSAAPSDGDTVLIVGAGATAYAAAVAVHAMGLRGVIANRTGDRAQRLAASMGFASIPFQRMAEARPAVIIDTIPASAGWSAKEIIPDRGTGVTLISADYSSSRQEDFEEMRQRGVRVHDGTDLLRAQAVEQSATFLEICSGVTFSARPEPEALR